MLISRGPRTQLRACNFALNSSTLASPESRACATAAPQSGSKATRTANFDMRPLLAHSWDLSTIICRGAGFYLSHPRVYSEETRVPHGDVWIVPNPSSFAPAFLKPYAS